MKLPAWLPILLIPLAPAVTYGIILLVLSPMDRNAREQECEDRIRAVLAYEQCQTMERCSISPANILHYRDNLEFLDAHCGKRQ